MRFGFIENTEKGINLQTDTLTIDNVNEFTMKF